MMEVASHAILTAQIAIRVAFGTISRADGASTPAQLQLRQARPMNALFAAIAAENTALHASLKRPPDELRPAPAFVMDANNVELGVEVCPEWLAPSFAPTIAAVAGAYDFLATLPFSAATRSTEGFVRPSVDIRTVAALDAPLAFTLAGMQLRAGSFESELQARTVLSAYISAAAIDLIRDDRHRSRLVRIALSHFYAAHRGEADAVLHSA